MEQKARRTFASLGVRNFRLFMSGQVISMCGTWMQTIGLSWLVLTLTHSGTQLGAIVAAQFLPILLFGAWGGLVADRFNKRRLLLVTQSLMGLLALILGMLVLTHTIQLWMVYVLATLLGLVTVVDSPTRQSFVIEMVGPENVRNAVTLNSTMVNTARVIGPSIAGILIATVGVGACFVINGASYLAVLIALKLMNETKLFRAAPAVKAAGQIKDGLKYVWSEPKLKATLIMMFIIGTFAYEFPVIFPLFATVTLHGNATTYSSMMVATGIGAITGGLYTASHSETREKQLLLTAATFGLSIIAASLMPVYYSVLVLLVVVGALSVLFIALANTTLQLSAEPSMRGRVMALWSIAFQGTTPIGGPLIGYLSDKTNPRIGLAAGGVSCLFAATIGWLVFRRSRQVPVQSID